MAASTVAVCSATDVSTAGVGSGSVAVSVTSIVEVGIRFAGDAPWQAVSAIVNTISAAVKAG